MPSIEVKDFKNISNSAVGKNVQKHKYAIFTHKGDAETLGETYKYIHGTWFPNKDYLLNEDFDFEYYTCDEKGNDIIEIHIPIIDK